ncbi:MAG: hypothetical protein MJ183_01710 [Treponemataceae bacterium]|nr:hypothetical protein [Treponemataceae bacterium]
MLKKENYVYSWIFSFIAGILSGMFISTPIWFLGFIFSFGYKIFLGVNGFLALSKGRKSSRKLIKSNIKALVPFFVVAMVFLQSAVILTYKVITSGSEEIASGSVFAVLLTVFVLIMILATFFWELEFLSSTESKPLRRAFSILTPLTIFTFEFLIALFSGII